MSLIEKSCDFFVFMKKNDFMDISDRGKFHGKKILWCIFEGIPSINSTKCIKNMLKIARVEKVLRINRK